MKTLFTIVLFVFSISTSTAQEKNIETQAVTLENFIPFIVENYPLNQNSNPSELQNITFVVQVSEQELAIEDKVILMQAFKLLSKRLLEDDQISIIVYSGFNGIASKQSSAKDLKKILFAINNLKSSVKEFHEDGIDLAYNYAKDNFDENAINSVVMVRNPNMSKRESGKNNILKNNASKKNNGAVLITALSLLPELIAVIKN